jgi:hypothetical protein
VLRDVHQRATGERAQVQNQTKKLATQLQNVLAAFAKTDEQSKLDLCRSEFINVFLADGSSRNQARIYNHENNDDNNEDDNDTERKHKQSVFAQLRSRQLRQSF